MSRYSNRIMKNNVHATLSTAISSIATTIQLTSGQGERFGNLFPILATLESVSDGKVMKREIVQITSRSGDALVVERAFAPCPSNDDANSQTQTSFSFDIDDTISMYIPKEFFDNIANGFTNAEGELDGLNYDGNARMKVIKAVSGTPLKIDIVAGVYRCGGDTVQYSGTTDVSVSDNSTNYVMIDGSGTIQISTSARDTRYTRLAEVVTSGGTITSISDRRSDVVGGTLGGLEIHSLTEKKQGLSDDEIVIADSETGFTNKRMKMVNAFYSSFFTWTGNTVFGTGGFSSDIDHGFRYYSGTGFIGTKRGTYSKSFSISNGYGTAYYKGYRYFVANNNVLYRCDETLDISNNSNWETLFSVQSYSQIAGLTDEYIYLYFGQNIYKYNYSGTLLTTIDLGQGPTTVQLGHNCFWAGFTSSPQGFCKFDMNGQKLETYNLQYGYYLAVKGGILFVVYHTGMTCHAMGYA